MNINLPAPNVMGDTKFDFSKWNTGPVTSGLYRYGNYQQPKKQAAQKKVAPAPKPKQGDKVYAGGNPDFDMTGGQVGKPRSQQGGSGSGLIGSALKAPETQSFTPESYTPESYKAETYKPKSYSAQTYTAQQREVKGNETVRQQLQELLDENGKYLQTARTRAAETSNRRGLLNSSMAAGAGERAAIESAMPIALQDAQTYSNRALANMSAVNQSRQFNTGAKNDASRFNTGEANRAGEFNASANNQAGQFNANARNQADQFNANARNQAGQFNASESNRAGIFNTGEANNMAQREWEQLSNQAHDTAMKEMDTESRSELVDLEMRWNRVIDQDRNAATAYSTAMQALATLNSNGELSPEQQREGTQQIINQMEGFMNLTSKIGGSTPEEAQQGREQFVEEIRQQAQAERQAQEEAVAKREEEIRQREEELRAREEAARNRPSSRNSRVGSGGQTE